MGKIIGFIFLAAFIYLGIKGYNKVRYVLNTEKYSGIYLAILVTIKITTIPFIIIVTVIILINEIANLIK